MNQDRIQSILEIGETVGVELFLGVTDDGVVEGISETMISDMIKNFIKMISNPEVLSPTVYLIPEKIRYQGKYFIHIHIPASSEVHKYKRIVYDRVDDADVKITSTNQMAMMYIRKQNVFTEKKIYPYVTKNDLRLDLLPLCRQRAINKRGDHPWKDMTDDDLLRSAGLPGVDYATGEKGFNLAAIMLLGKDEVIQSVSPAYKTDAILRKVNVDRYDDREIIKTNLIESYDQLILFAKKHLWDKFYLENDRNISLWDKIAREMLANTLIHREYTSSYIAKFVIEGKNVYRKCM